MCLSGEAVGLIACCGVVVCAVSISRVLWAGPITWRYRRLWETDYHGAKTCTDSRSIMVEEVLSKWTRQKGLRFSAGKERNIQNGGDH